MGPDPVRSVSLEETRTQTHTECDHVSSQEDQPCSHLDLRLLASRGLRTHLSAVFTPAGGTWDGSHSRGRCEPMRPYPTQRQLVWGQGSLLVRNPEYFFPFGFYFPVCRGILHFRSSGKEKTEDLFPCGLTPSRWAFPSRTVQN